VLTFISSNLQAAHSVSLVSHEPWIFKHIDQTRRLRLHQVPCARLRHSLLVIRPMSTSLMGICPNTTIGLSATH